MEKYYHINREGRSICCKLYCSDPGGVRQVILYGHGFGGHKDNRAAEKFAHRVLEKNKGVAIVTFDWPCHGDDVRKLLRLEDCADYLRLMLEDLQTRFAPEAVLGYATSFGGYLFLKYLSEEGNPFRRLALRCPAVPMYRVLTQAIMTEDLTARLEKGKPVLVGFDRKIAVDRAFLESLQAQDIAGRDYLPYADDLLILHGTEDEIVPIDAVRHFAEENVIEFIPVERADHRFQNPAAMELATNRILDFFGLR